MNLIETVTGENYRLRIWSNAEVPTHTIQEIVKAVTSFFTWQFEVDARLRDHLWQITFKWGGYQGSGREEPAELLGYQGYAYCLSQSELPVTANFIRCVAERIAIPIRRANGQQSEQRQQDVARATADWRDFQQRIEYGSSMVQRQEQWRRMRRMRQLLATGQLEIPSSLESLRQGFEAIGDITCRNNAKSQYIRCAVNPCGPCEGCNSYESL